MSMKEHPSYGYVLEASKLVPAFRYAETKQEALLLIEEGDWEGFQKLCEKKLMSGLPCPVETFLFGDEDSSEELEKGELYCRWDEEQLYKKEETPELEMIQAIIGTSPEQKSWAMWG